MGTPTTSGHPVCGRCDNRRCSIVYHDYFESETKSVYFAVGVPFVANQFVKIKLNKLNSQLWQDLDRKN